MREILYFRVFVIPMIFQISLVSFTLGQNFSFSLGNRDALNNEAGVPVFPWFPDGHITMLTEPNNDKHIMYWSGHENYRTFGDFPFPEYQNTLSPEEAILVGVWKLKGGTMADPG
ncbi:MAG: hypothetical protein IPN33_12215 [Saprospiraceae bacterium]|nr:hypothetical protein [Saprospiraceae bacterium]